jgi:signal transduction histidine kinase
MTGPVRADDKVAGWLRSHPMVVDGVLAAATALATAPMGRSVADVFFAVAAAAALIVRRKRLVASSVAVLVLSLVVVVGQVAPGVVVLLPVLITVYTLAVYGSRVAGLAAVLTTIAGGALLVLVPLAHGEEVSPIALQGVLGAGTILSVTVWLAGSLRRAGLRNVEHLRERARLLELEQAQQARLGALAERHRIAREMHDIVAHSLTVIVVQADGGRVAATHNGFSTLEAAATVFGDIATAGRSALADIRALLGLLHDDEDSAPPDQESGSPQPGVADIPALVAEFNRTGMSVSLSVSGEARALPAGTALTAYRAVQEALTNTMKHAGTSARATVELSWHTDHLSLHITDDGANPGSGTPGEAAGKSLGKHGLRGMRERVAAHGGSFDAGPRPGLGFAVHLRLPYASAEEPGS